MVCSGTAFAFTLTVSEVDTWEAGGDGKTIAQRERKHNHILVLYVEKQLSLGCRSNPTEDSCE
jgi:hypothetical protein